MIFNSRRARSVALLRTLEEPEGVGSRARMIAAVQPKGCHHNERLFFCKPLRSAQKRSLVRDVRISLVTLRPAERREQLRVYAIEHIGVEDFARGVPAAFRGYRRESSL